MDNKDKKKERKERVTSVIDKELMRILREHDVNRSELFNDAARRKVKEIQRQKRDIGDDRE